MSIPESATHKAVGPRIDCWYKNINCLGFEFMNQGGSEWLKRDGMPNWPYERIANEQPKPWSGPEDGLPPVGSTVQVWDKEPHKFYAKHVGKSVSILAHRIGSYGEEVAVYCVKADDGTDEYHALVENCFRPIQSEPDARETAIRDVMDIAQVDCRVTAARLVDAGFKLPSKSGEDREQGISDLRDHIAHANFRRSPNSGDEELAKQLYGAGFRRERTPDNPFR